MDIWDTFFSSSRWYPNSSQVNLQNISVWWVKKKSWNSNNTKNLVLRLQISGYHQEDCPAMENNGSRTETGFLCLYFLTVSIIICHNACTYLSRWGEKSLIWEHIHIYQGYPWCLLTPFHISCLHCVWSWANRNAVRGFKQFCLGNVEEGLVSLFYLLMLSLVFLLCCCCCCFNPSLALWRCLSAGSGTI